MLDNHASSKNLESLYIWPIISLSNSKLSVTFPENLLYPLITCVLVLYWPVILAIVVSFLPVVCTESSLNPIPVQQQQLASDIPEVFLPWKKKKNKQI